MKPNPYKTEWRSKQRVIGLLALKKHPQAALSSTQVEVMHDRSHMYAFFTYAGFRATQTICEPRTSTSFCITAESGQRPPSCLQKVAQGAPSSSLKDEGKPPVCRGHPIGFCCQKGWRLLSPTDDTALQKHGRILDVSWAPVVVWGFQKV